MDAERLLGAQEPTHRLYVEGDTSSGDDAIELAESAGLHLDPFQQLLLRDGCTRIGRRWGAIEVAIELSRRNGKSEVFLARVLAGVYLFGEKRIVYTAHSGETVMDAFGRLSELIMDSPHLRKRVKGEPTRGNGKEAIHFHSGARIRFRTRTASGGRGLDGDLVVLDESQDIGWRHVSALYPVILARADPQLWYGGSAGDKGSEVLGDLVRRSEAAEPGLVMHRYAADEDDDPADPRTQARVNPAYGRRIQPDVIAQLQRTMPPEKFARECLGIGDYPRPAGEDWVIPQTAYERSIDRTSAAVGPLVWCVEVSFDRQRASIGVAGRRADGRVHVEVVENQVGTRWIAPRLAQLTARHPTLGVVVDPSSPTGSILGELADAGIVVTPLKSTDLTQAWGGLYDSWTGTPATVLHRGAGWVTAALAAASTRALGGATTWSRQAGEVDVTPILAITWAAHGLRNLLGRPTAPPARPRRVRVGAGRARSETGDLATRGF